MVKLYNPDRAKVPYTVKVTQDIDCVSLSLVDETGYEVSIFALVSKKGLERLALPAPDDPSIPFALDKEGRIQLF